MSAVSWMIIHGKCGRSTFLMHQTEIRGCNGCTVEETKRVMPCKILWHFPEITVLYKTSLTKRHLYKFQVNGHSNRGFTLYYQTSDAAPRKPTSRTWRSAYAFHSRVITYHSPPPLILHIANNSAAFSKTKSIYITNVLTYLLIRD